jgi:alpha-methylacyl-CoA racemase
MTEDRVSTGPLADTRVIELGGIGPGPFCGMLLADLGADVIRVHLPADAGTETTHPVLHRGRRSLALDLKDPAGLAIALRLVETADVLIEGFRPGVTERLGLGPTTCLERNRRLVYGRMTGWGQEGPLAHEPGHDINYIALAGALGAIGQGDGDPVVPLNLVADMGGGGMLLALGIVAALLHARTTGEGQVIDAAMTDGTALQLAGIYGLLARGRWRDRRGANVLDGAAPFYRAYRCADDKHLAVGCLEPTFYGELLRVLDLVADPRFAEQYDEGRWPEMAVRLAEIFATRSRDEWASVFDGQGACVTPVLSLREAAVHPHNVARGTYTLGGDGAVEPSPAPRFHGTPAPTPGPARTIGADTEDVLAEVGLRPAEIRELRERGVVG